MTFEEFRDLSVKEHVESGGKEEDLVCAFRPHRDGSETHFAISLAPFRHMELEELEDELEDMQDELDEITEVLEDFVAEHGTLFALGSELYEDYEGLLDEQYAMQVHIREVMNFLP